MKQYLVWIEVGGENGDWVCSQDHYKLCEGSSEEEVINDWLRKLDNEFFTENTKHSYGNWNCYGRIIRIFELKESFEDNNWKYPVWK